MKLIIKYFTCEGRFSCLYTYHIRLLMHFTRVRMMNLPYFICKNIEKMAHYGQRKPFPQQLNIIYHFSLIKIVVLHQLSLLNIPWDTFIAHEIFKGPQVIPSVPQEERGGHQDSQVFMRLKLQVCQCLSPMREAQGGFFLPPGKYYLHQRWKGSRFLHQTTGKCYLHQGWKGLCLLLQLYRLASSQREKTNGNQTCMRRSFLKGKT